MADNNNGHVYEVSRDSYTCVSVEMQGYLDKKGVLGNKSKLWCSIQQSTLYMQKTQKPQRQGDTVKTIDLKDCHQVRKVTTEITGTHFEICQRKKTHVFICPSSESCTMWVKSLQTAMALKDAGPFNPDTESQESTNIYEAVDESLRHSRPQTVSSYRIADYCEPSDVKKVSSVGNKDNDYWELGDVQANIRTSQTATQSSFLKLHTPSGADEPESRNSNTYSQDVNKQVYSDARSEASEAGQCECDQEVYSDGCSLAPTDKAATSVTSQVNAALTQRNSVTRRASKDRVYSDAYSATSVHHQPAAAAHSSLIPVDRDDLKDAVNDNEDESPFQSLLDSLTGRDSPVPDYIHPLNEEDMKPVEELRQFLNKYQELCYVNCLSLPTEDPVGSLKTYLETLSIDSSHKIGHW